MKNTPEQIWKEFQKEMKENDKKVQEQIYKKTDEQKSKEFAEFIKNNDCKIMKGGKNGKNKNS